MINLGWWTSFKLVNKVKINIVTLLFHIFHCSSLSSLETTLNMSHKSSKLAFAWTILACSSNIPTINVFAFWNRVLNGWQHQNPLNFWHFKNKLNLYSKFFLKLHIFNYNTYGFVNSKCKLVLVLDCSMFFQTIIISLYFNKSNSNNCSCQVFPKPQKTIRFHERTINFVLSFFFFYFFSIIVGLKLKAWFSNFGLHWLYAYYIHGLTIGASLVQSPKLLKIFFGIYRLT